MTVIWIFSWTPALVMCFMWLLSVDGKIFYRQTIISDGSCSWRRNLLSLWTAPFVLIEDEALQKLIGQWKHLAQSTPASPALNLLRTNKTGGYLLKPFHELWLLSRNGWGFTRHKFMERMGKNETAKWQRQKATFYHNLIINIRHTFLIIMNALILKVFNDPDLLANEYIILALS
jgi:hypothetical protein